MIKMLTLVLFGIFSFQSFSEKPSLENLCEQNDPMACKEFGILNKSSDPIQKSCNLGLGEGCTQLGLILFREKKIEDGEAAFQKGCNLNEGDSCSYLGAFIHKKDDIEQARLLYLKACQLNSGKGCYNLGILTETLGYDNEALQSYYKACEKDIAQGCVNYGYLLEKNKGDLKQIKGLYKKACDLKSNIGCKNLALVNNLKIELKKRAKNSR